jgi:hypothetical protein
MQTSGDPKFRISALEGQLRLCQFKLAESHRKFETELVKHHVSTRDTLEALQKEHASELNRAQQKIDNLTKKIAEMEANQEMEVKDEEITPSPKAHTSSGPPSLQPKSPSRKRKHLKKGVSSLLPNNTKSKLLPLSGEKPNSDTNLLSLKDRPKSSSFGDLSALTKEKPPSDIKLAKTPQVSPATKKKSEPTRRESGEKPTITALVAESLSNPASISAIRKELKSDSFTPKMKRKFTSLSPGTSSPLASISPKNGKELAGEGKGGGKSPFNSHKDLLAGNSSAQ